MTTDDCKLRHYRLDNEHKPVECSLFEWARDFELKDRRVGWFEHELFVVSTVFLGLDLRFWGKGPPVLFETMVFEGHGPRIEGATMTLGHDIEMTRYSSWDDAEAGHAAMVKRMLERAEKAKVEIK